MNDDTFNSRGRPVPRGRFSRLGQFGRLAGGIAGGMIAEGARRVADGEPPRMRDMLLTPGNVGRVANRLSHLRGAAMKLGQMISMDAGDLLPVELARIMGRLRDSAHPMPLMAVLRFAGAASRAEMEKKRNELFDHIAALGLKTVGAPVFAFYDPPWTLPPFSRNEVMAELAKQ
ncbi:MAG: heme-binding protein [Alphaproteobacteria bacterium]